MRRKRLTTRTVLYIVAVVITIGFLIPILLIFFGAFRDPIEFFKFPPSLDARFTLDNFRFAFSPQISLQRYLLNSLFYAITSTAIALAAGLPAAYAMSRSKSPFTRYFMYIIVLIRAVPPISLLVPLYSIFTKLYLTGTYLGVILAYVSFHLPFIVWIMRGFYAEISDELIDAAYMDGCNKYGAFLRVALPLSVPGIAVVAIFTCIGSWNELLYALVLTTNINRSAPVFIGSFYSDTSTSYGMLYASSAVTIAPLLILTLIFQKRIVRGLAFGGVKE